MMMLMMMMAAGDADISGGRRCLLDKSSRFAILDGVL